METRVVEFAEVLRQNGLRVSLSETQDAARAIAETGVDDRELVRVTLQATLCKRSTDSEVFNRAFDFYFSGASRLLEGVEKSLVARLTEEGLLEGDDLKMIIFALDRLAGQMSPLAAASVSGDRARLASLFRQASLQVDYSRLQNALQAGFFSRRLLSSAGFERMRSDLEVVEQELRSRGVSAQGVEVVSRHLRDAMATVESAARAEVQREAAARLQSKASGPGERPIHSMSRQEVAIAERAVRALAEKLKARLVRRQRSRKRGTLHPRRTLRKNLVAGGVPMVPQFRSRRPLRPDVIVLCDVSDSVRNTSRLMLLFTHTLQSLFARVRSFIFVSELGETTKHFRDTEPAEAFEVATSSGIISLASNSNYGHAFATFARAYLGAVSRRTTVIVIGDGRNNHNAPHAWALDEIKRKARRLVWLCTEPRSNWGFGDSEMAAYSAACSQVVVVQTLNDLERLAHQLVPR